MGSCPVQCLRCIEHTIAPTEERTRNDTMEYAQDFHDAKSGDQLEYCYDDRDLEGEEEDW